MVGLQNAGKTSLLRVLAVSASSGCPADVSLTRFSRAENSLSSKRFSCSISLHNLARRGGVSLDGYVG